MPGHQVNLSDPDPRASMRSSRVSYLQDDDSDDDDEYALAALGISDGYRPSGPQTQPHSNPLSPSRSTSVNQGNSNFNSHDAAQSSSTARVPPPRPSSITKPHRPRGSLSLRHDGDRTSIEAARSERPEHTHVHARTATVVSPFAHPDDGDDTSDDDDRYQGPSGPSFPYHMYSQNIRLGRTASMATSSTVPVSEQSYSGPSGPTHPYGMYPQNAVDTDSIHGRGAQAAIPVGFGGVDNYQRRLGPEGEEAGDLIGPDGHTEQLPPYTRYPDEAYERKALGIQAPQAQSNAGESSRSVPAGAGGLGLATRNPEFSSTDNLEAQDSPVSRQSMRSLGSSATRTNTNTNPTARAIVDEKDDEDDDEDEDAEDEKSGLKKVAKRKIWGIVPCWAIVLAVVVLVLMGAILGAVIGSILGKQMHKGPPGDSPDPAADSTPTITDLIPLPTVPPNMPPPIGGSYALPLSLFRSPNQCFNDTTESGTWICNIVFSQLSMVLTPRLKAPDTSNWSFDYKFNDTYTLDNNVFSYGMQPPNFKNSQDLMLVDDPLEPDRGPAWAFQTQYNKTVVIPNEFLSISTTPSPSSHRRRGGFLLGGDFQRKGIAKAGDKPWVCYWEHTLLETFIYTSQNNSFERANSASAAASSSSVIASMSSHSPSPVTSTPTPYTSPAHNIKAYDPDALSSGDSDSDGVDDEDSETARAYNGESRWERQLDHHHRYDQDGYLLPRYMDDPTPTSSSSMYPGATGYFDNNPMPTDYSPVYPQVVKMLERRVPSLARQPPWCRQYEVPDDGTDPRPSKDSHGNFIDVEIQEKSNSADVDLVGLHDGIQREFHRLQRERQNNYPHYRRDGSSSTSSGIATEDRMSDCGCLWWLY